MANQRKAARTAQTLRTIIAQHNAGQGTVHLQAVATLYLTMLECGADDATWQLFHKVASLPLTTTKLQPECATHGYFHMGRKARVEGPCDNYPKCGHRNLEVATTVNLCQQDSYLLERGQRLGAKVLSSFWGKQLAEALGGTVA